MARRRHGGAAGLLAPSRRRDGVLARLQVTAGPWAENIPPVPDGFDVTVSFGSEALVHEHGEALELLGYRVVGTPETVTPLPPVADFLISEALLEQRPMYWRALASQAARAYNLAFGPAAALVADIVAAHTRLSSS
jgi:hypothetical protein